MTDISKLIERGYAKPIENLEYTKGFKGYWVLKNGKIWSEPRMKSKGGFLKAQKCGPTKKDPTKKEYLFVKLFNSSKSRSKKVHIIVAEAFIGPRPIGANGRPLDTDHIDHDQFNNHYKNLQYLTRRENIQRSNLNKKNKSSSYLGVFKKANNKFISKIFVDGYRKQIGTFNEEIEAAKAYDLKCYELFGEKTILNFPEFKEEYKKIIKLQKENPQQRELDFDGQENKKEKSICWLGIIPEDMKDELRYPTEEEIEIALYEAENLTEEEYDSMSEKELEDFHEKAKKIVKEKMNDS